MEIDWVDGFFFKVEADCNNITIQANKEGLFSLANQFMELAKCLFYKKTRYMSEEEKITYKVAKENKDIYDKFSPLIEVCDYNGRMWM